jgi:hypothetical protein
MASPQPLSASAAAAALDEGAGLSSLSLRTFLEALSVRHGLQLTEREIERSTQVLQEQWFTYAEGQKEAHSTLGACVTAA